MSSENYFGMLTEKLLSEAGSSYSDTVGYEPIEMTTRHPEDSELEWNYHSDPKSGRLLKRYPPKLLDRAAEAVSSNLDIDQEIEIGGKYLGVESDRRGCRIVAENCYGAAGVEAYQRANEIIFTEYLADEREELDFEGEPERLASTNVPEEISFEDFFEDTMIKSNIIVIR